MFYFSESLQSDFDETVSILKEKLKEEGFGVLTEIDVQQTLKEKLDVDFRKYCIFGVCNPPLAYKALQAEDKIGLLLPCKVIVQEKSDGGVEVSALDPQSAMDIVEESDELKSVASDAAARLRKVVEKLRFASESQM